MKNLTIIIAALLCLSLTACTSYEYDMPDTSNAYPTYSVKELPDDLENELSKIASTYGLTLHYANVKWRTIVHEKDASGNKLYEGEPRKKASKNATTLSVSYIATCMISNSSRYYDICQFDFEKEFPLAIAPHSTAVKVAKGDKYTARRPDNYPITFKIDRSDLPVSSKCNELGYNSIADVDVYYAIKDAQGDTTSRAEYDSDRGIITTANNKYADIEVRIIGFDNRYMKSDVGAFFFRDIPLEDINNSTIHLTTDMDYEFVIYNKLYNYNVDRSSLPVIDKCEELGYSIADVTMHVTEYDENGKQLRTVQHRTIDGKLQTKDGRTIDVEVKLYGLDSRYNKIHIGSWWFRGISIPDIDGTTYQLTTENATEFVTAAN